MNEDRQNQSDEISRESISPSGVPRECASPNVPSPSFWFALRITYSRELALKSYLDGRGIENFVPMRYEYVTRNGRNVRKLVPAVHNLIFVHAARVQIDELKLALSLTLPIRYIMNRETHQPIVVPDRQMKNFIAVAGSGDEQIVYLDAVAPSLHKGDKVRIISGPFAGVEGYFLRVKGDRRVVVTIEGVMAVATAFVHPGGVERV